MKKLLFSVFFAFTSFASALNLGDSIPTFTINDQFEKPQTIKEDTKLILVAADKATSEILRDYLLKKEKGFLESKKAYYVADISGMPSLIAKFFALPKMKKYPFSILLLDDENKDKFSKKENNITIYTITDKKISDIKYIKTIEELAEVLK